MEWTVTATQDEDAWFEDYVRLALASEPASLPPKSQHFGKATLSWFETEPGIFHINAKGGTVDDRAIGQIILREELLAHGFKRASYTVAWDHSDERLIKEANWDEVEAKAKRLIESNKVQILRNSYNTIVGQVEGDHGTYQTEISRDDPNSQAITLWQCDCKWDQFAWQRTRQWKKYEGRVCSHVLATIWMAQGMPLDEDVEPGSSPLTPNPSAPAVPGSIGPEVAPGMGPRTFSPTMEPQQIAPGSESPAPPGQAPSPLIPPWPNDPALQPAVNPVSVPGQKPQTPLNPVQNAGGTFSSVPVDTLYRMSTEQFVNGDMVSNNEEDFGVAVGLNAGEQVPIPANSVGEVLGTDPLGLVNVYFAGPMAERGNLEPHGVKAWFWPKDIRKRPDVRAPGPAVRRR